jgi:hypothetical protein
LNFKVGFAALVLFFVASPLAAKTDAVTAYGSAHAKDGDFTLLQLFTDSDSRLVEEWKQPTPPNLTTTSQTVRNKPIFMALILSGCQPDPSGKCDVTGDIQILDPSGGIYGDYKRTPIYSGPIKSPNLLMLSPTMLGMTVEDGEPLGRYRFVVTVTDHIASKALKVEDSVVVSEALTLSKSP